MNTLVSIIINNYNYGCFLKEAIDSALAQTYSYTEVIAVDDGSTDDSRVVIDSFGDKIIAVLKNNGGQASAFNAGFQKSNGNVIIFLDSDDVLFTDAVEKVMQDFDSGTAKIHWPLCVMNEQGKLTGEITPKMKLPVGDFREHALHNGPPFFLNPPTTGNAWSRKFLESVLPMPELQFRIGADTYLFETVAFWGNIRRLDQPAGAYRIHSRNNYNNKSFLEKLRSEVSFYDALLPLLHGYCRKLGLHPDEKAWRYESWFHRLQIAVEEIMRVVPENNSFVLIDDAAWDIGRAIEGRIVFPFLEANGLYAGAPEDDRHAILELQHMREKGAGYVVFGWPGFWWLEQYKLLSDYLQKNHNLIFKSSQVVIYQLNKKQ